MTKTERTVTAVLILLLGTLLITLRGTFLEMLLVVGGVVCIALGAIDVFQSCVPPGILKIVGGGLLILCCVFVVKAIMFVLASVLSVVGVLLLYDMVKQRKCRRSVFLKICDSALPILLLSIGALILFAEGEGEDWLFIVCGILTILIGALQLSKAFIEE